MSKRLTPPDDLAPEAVAEWHRVIAAAKDVGNEIKPADASCLATYCRTWLINRQAFAHIQQHGSTIEIPNGTICHSKQYQSWENTTKILRALLEDLGASPKSRKFDKQKKANKTTKLDY